MWLTGFEVLDVFRRHLRDFEQTNRALVIHEGTTLFRKSWSELRLWFSRHVAYLDVSLGLVGDLHDELGLAVNHVLENVLVDTGNPNCKSERPFRKCNSDQHTRHPNYPSWRRIGTPCPPRSAGRGRPNGGGHCTSHRAREGTSASCRHLRSSGRGGGSP